MSDTNRSRASHGCVKLLGTTGIQSTHTSFARTADRRTVQQRYRHKVVAVA